MDARGVLAAVMLALNAKDLPPQDKSWFAKKKLSFLREHGSLEQIQEARADVFKYEKLLEQHLKEKEEAEKKKKLEAEEKAEKERKAAADEEKAKVQPQQQQQQQQQQQFPTPVFGQDGTIAYAPTETSAPPTNAFMGGQPPAYQEVPPVWLQDSDKLTPEELELQRQMQNHKNRQYEDLRTKQMMGGPSPPYGNHGNHVPPHDMSQPPPGLGGNKPRLVPPPPFPTLKPYTPPNAQE